MSNETMKDCERADTPEHEATIPPGHFDGDTEETRAAFCGYDIRVLARTRSAWQIWRDACAWQARATSQATVINDEIWLCLTSAGEVIGQSATPIKGLGWTHFRASQATVKDDGRGPTFDEWLEEYRKGKPYWSQARTEICRDTWNASRAAAPQAGALTGEQRMSDATPEGCTPADARKLREANHRLADENRQHARTIAFLRDQNRRIIETAERIRDNAARAEGNRSPIDGDRSGQSQMQSAAQKRGG
jgi:hypothetical protein